MTKQADNNLELHNQQEHGAMPPRPKRSRGGLVFALVLVLIFGGIALWRVLTPKEQLEELPEQPVEVQTAMAEIAPISVSTTITGKVRASDEASVFASGGEVRHINVAVGDYIKKGQRLFSLDTSQMQGSYAQAQVSRDLAREGVATAQQNLDRMQALYDSAAIPLSQLEQAQTALTSAELQLRQAEAAVSSAVNSMSLLNFDSPISGYVTEVNIKEGMYPGQLPAVAIASLDDLEISASVSEYLIGHLKEGAPVTFKITSLVATTYEGKVKTVGLAPASGSLTYPITVTVEAEEDSGIMPGMFAEISLPANHKEEALVIPASALITRGGITYVAVLEGDIPWLRQVELGLNNGELVEITAGLSAGDTVITKGQHFINEGEAVTRLAD